MIIQIRGTSGSGKTWAMRSIMGMMGDWNCVYEDNRKQPIWYESCSEWSGTVVLGHYESACGGCDNVGSARAVFELQQRVSSDFPFVLCEGLLLSEDVKWTVQMPDVRVFFLTTPLERCLEQIGSRRAEAGNEKPLNPANTVNRFATIERARQKLSDAGVYCRRCSAAQAPKLILDMMRQSCTT